MKRKLTLWAAALFFVFQACQKPEDLLNDSANTDAYVLMTPAYYRSSDANNDIEVRFYESQRVYSLSLNDPGFINAKALLDRSISAHTPLRISVSHSDLFMPVLSGVREASAQEVAGQAELRQIIPEPATIQYIIPSHALMDSIFDFCRAQGCTTGTVSIDYCIPFQYVVDGCYARAHKMRQIMETIFGYTCEKVFSYEGPYGPLAVDAGDCCVAWWYHVAPLVTVKEAHGYKKYVIDPSMFDAPVSIDTWTAAQENHDCLANADFGHTEITPGYIYAPGGSTDNYYSSTNYVLQLYAPLVTCP